MKLEKLTARAGSNIQDTLDDIPWSRVAAAGTLIASACLLISGKRKAALAVAAAGTAVVLLEDPRAIRTLWDNMPDYVQAGQKFLGRVEGFVEEIAAQGEHLKKVISRVG